LAVLGGAEQVDKDVGQGDAEGIGDIEALRILQPRPAAAHRRVSCCTLLLIAPILVGNI
jgi:hypothetical protein